MEKKPDHARKQHEPIFTGAINPNQLALGIDLHAVQSPRIFEARSSVVKEHFDRDIERMRQTLSPGRIEPKLAIAGQQTCASGMHLQIRQNIDPRTGHVDNTKMMPGMPAAPLQLSATHPMHPEHQLSAAMKKLGHRP